MISNICKLCDSELIIMNDSFKLARCANCNNYSISVVYYAKEQIYFVDSGRTICLVTNLIGKAEILFFHIDILPSLTKTQSVL